LAGIIDHESDHCFPYLITMQLSEASAYSLDLSLDKASSWPSCDFWNVSAADWDTRGCFVHGVSSTTVTCGCTHLTTFSVSSDEIVPEANMLTELDWRALTVANLWRYPTVWLTTVSLLVIFAVICLIHPRSEIQTKSILAFEDVIYRSVQQEKLWRDIAGKEIKYISDYLPNTDKLGGGLKVVAAGSTAKRKLCFLQYKLWKAYLRNDHTLLSVFQRTAGTNFALKQRLGCFFMYLCTIMVLTATFYGLEQSTIIQDVFASFTISLFGTLPVLIVRKLFEKSRPTEQKSDRHNLQEIEQKTAASLSPIARSASIASMSSSSNGEGQASTTGTNVRAFMTERGNVTMAVFSEHVNKLYDEEDRDKKIQAISEIRRYLFESMFPLPTKCKVIAWIIVVLWSAAACITAIVYGLSFDIQYSAKTNTQNSNAALYEEEPCWNSTLQLSMESALSKQWFLDEQNTRAMENASSYGGSDSSSWLLSLAQSLLTSLLLWQPLTVYVLTWLKIWMFTWNLKMQVGPGNVVALCKRCCCAYRSDRDMHHEAGDHDNGNDEIHVQQEQQSESIAKMNLVSQFLSGTKATEVVANENRPVDIISFLGNEVWIIDDVDNEDNENVSGAHVELQEMAMVKALQIEQHSEQPVLEEGAAADHDHGTEWAD